MNHFVQVKFGVAKCRSLVRHHHLMPLAVSLVLVNLAFAHGQSKPPPDAPTESKTAKPQEDKPKAPVASPTGTIKGRVTGEDGRVLSNATVLARAINGSPGMKAGQVDSEGRFAFEDVPAALYIVFASAPGYIDEQVASEIEHWPRYLIGSQINLRLIKGGVITGTVTNSKGQPVVGVPVRAVPTKGAGMFMSVLGASGMSETDDRGVYRIYGLPPGQYTVDAGGGGQYARFAASGFDLDAPTYYPSSPYDTAVPIAVRAGDETAGIDIRYKGIDGHSISGSVTGKLDSTLGNNAVSVVLGYVGTTNMVGVSVTGIAEQNRSFSFNGVADGDYDLFALFVSSLTESVAASTRRVTVRGGDVTGVELSLTQLGSIAGSFKLDPIAPELKCDQRKSELMEVLIEAPRDDPKKNANKMLALMTSAFNASFTANGGFSIRNLEAGSYRPRIKLPTEAWYVRAINLPSRSAQPVTTTPDRNPVAATNPVLKPAAANSWQGTVPLKAGEKLAGISILVGQDAAGLRGRFVTPEGSAIPPGLRVHLVPSEREEAGNILRYLETTVESNGSFTLTNIAPGRYFILPRIEPTPTTEETPRPVALDASARNILRREAEALNDNVDLKPCQRKADVELKIPVARAPR